MERLNNFKPIIGDDLPYHSLYYRDIPKGFGFSALEFPSDCPRVGAIKDKLIKYADLFYRNYEIVGNTIVDFQHYLQIDLMGNIDTLEKMLEVYDDDIAKPTQSRTIKRTYDTKESTDATASDTNTGTVKSDLENVGYDLPIDNPTGQATEKSTSDGTTTNNLKNESKANSATAHTGTEIEEWSDVGVAPNYILLNGFLDNNRSYYTVFVTFFQNCFDLGEYIYG